MAGTVHIIGAGLAGLAAAVHLTKAGRNVVVHEAARFAGGRCRSYFEPSLGIRIDNGNHLVLSGNRAAFEFLALIGASDKLVGSPHADFPFADLSTGQRWTLRINDGRLPWWMFVANRRVPGTRATDYLALAKLLRASDTATIADVIGKDGVLYDKLWRPVLLSALNTDPEEASAKLAGAVVRESLAKGGLACRPMIAADGLATAFVDPALAYLERKGALVKFDHRVARLVAAEGRMAKLEFAEGDAITLQPEDRVILAVPAVVAGQLLPGLTVPDAFRSILNAHFKIAPPPGMPKILGVVGGITEWLFAFDDRLSVTVSAAERFIEGNREELARDIWREVATLAGLPNGTPLPLWQIIKERRATFAALPAQEKRRPGVDGAGLANLALAGDWTSTGLPATIEGAIRSGARAASWGMSTS